MRMRALKTFRLGETGEFVGPGRGKGAEFDVSDAAIARNYETRGLAEPVGGRKRTAKDNAVDAAAGRGRKGGKGRSK